MSTSVFHFQIIRIFFKVVFVLIIIRVLHFFLLFLGPRAQLRRVSSLDLGPLPFILFVKSLIYFVFLIICSF